MARDLSAYLQDVLDACNSIEDIVSGIAHDYGAVDDDTVFGLVYSDLIVLKAEVGELLGDCHDAN